MLPGADSNELDGAPGLARMPRSHSVMDLKNALAARPRLNVIGVAAVFVGAVLLLALTFVARMPPDSSPETPEVIDVEATRTKAELGDAAAQTRLGRAYANGQTLKQSYAEAAKWYRLAADHGHAPAQTALGELYEAGQGVPRDEAQAAQWYRRAADQGDTAGQYCLAVLYVVGKGVPRDVAEAIKWYRRSADQGNALAQFSLGTRCRDGDGVPRDPVEALTWLSLAAAQGLPDAASARDELKRAMTREQIAESRRRVDAFAKANR